MSDGRSFLTIPLKPWFRDHTIGGRIVLPAVETMLLLAARVALVHPGVDLKVMENVRFAKFLEIPAEADTLTGFVECAVVNSAGGVRAALFSRRQFKAMSRIKEHGEISFSPAMKDTCSNQNFDLAPPTGPVTDLSVDFLYRDLVPFGPNYQTLQEKLTLSENVVWGQLRAPQLPPDPIQKILGSPFPLDGALHAASVLGRQSVDFVPFPVGFDKRVITRPTQPGHRYETKVIQRRRTNEELIFDLCIFAHDGQVYEAITGLRMRDVSRALKMEETTGRLSVRPVEQSFHGNPGEPAQKDQRILGPGKIHAK